MIGPVTRRVRIEAAAPGTRTELAGDGYNVLWSPGDRIGVYVESGGTVTTSNAPLTFHELSEIEKSFLRTFSGIMHDRIEYPEEKKP